MGSDSRTATASSKSRPSWRDRHLNQLSDDQLAEVEQHRGDDKSVAEMVGVNDDMSSTDRASVAVPELPKQQAGPERQPERQAKHNRQPEQQRERQPHSQPERHSHYEDRAAQSDSRQTGTDSRHGYSQDSGRQRPATQRPDPRPDHLPDQTYDRARPERRDSPEKRFEQERYQQARHEQRNDTRSYYESDNTAPRSGPADAHESVAKKGLVDKVLDYKMPGPVKYSLMAIGIAVMVAVSLLKPIDNSSQSQLESAFVRASIGFGLARALNGVISVAQGTEFAVQPAGVGVNFSPGEILDPINDLVERFSWVMLLATSSIGIQQILLQISSWAGISVLLGGAGLFFLLTRMRNSSFARMADMAGKLLLAMLLVRFLIPVGSLANDWVYKQFLQPQYEESAAELEVASERIKEISTRQAEASESDGSITHRAKQFYSSMTSKFDFDGMLDDYKQSAETVSENAINLIVVFVLQTIIFPLLFMYLIYRLFRFALLPSRSPQ